jgi:Domain of unknown function (DUF4388)
MSEMPRPVRARRLTASVVPGRGTAGYGKLVAARVRRIATERRTGQLPFAGSSGGAIYFQDGMVVYAESRQTPGPAAAAGFGPAAAAVRAGIPPGDPLRAARSVAAIMAVAEPAVDAVLDLMSRESRPSRFRPAKVPAAGLLPGIGVAALLAEVARRQRLLRQMGPFLTADTAVARHPHVRQQSIRVSSLQWALLIRIRDGSTPRDLAWDLRRSVFSTTAEVYRLLALRLVAVDHDPGRAARPDDPGRGPTALSFIRAVSVEKGDTMFLSTSGAGSGDDR